MAPKILKSVTKMESVETVLEWEVDNFVLNLVNTTPIFSGKFVIAENSFYQSTWLEFRKEMFRVQGRWTYFALLHLHLEDPLSRQPNGVSSSQNPYSHGFACQVQFGRTHLTWPKVEIPLKQYSGHEILTEGRYMEIVKIPWENLRLEEISVDNKFMIKLHLHIFLGPPIGSSDMSQVGTGQTLDDLEGQCKERLVESYSKLLDNPIHADISIVCKGRTFRAHKAILAAQSSVFARMFETQMQESIQGVVTIQDMDAAIFELALEFIYTGKMKVETPNQDYLVQLLDCAEKYDLGGLKSICFCKMFQNISDKNAGEAAVAISMYGADLTLRQAVMDYCQKRHALLIQNPEYAQLFLQNPAAFLETKICTDN